MKRASASWRAIISAVFILVSQWSTLKTDKHTAKDVVSSRDVGDSDTVLAMSSDELINGEGAVRETVSFENLGPLLARRVGDVDENWCTVSLLKSLQVKPIATHQGPCGIRR